MEQSTNWNIDDIIPGEKLARRVLVPVARFAVKLSMLPSQSETRLSTHLQRSKEQVSTDT